MIFLYEKDEVRHSQLAKLIPSRGGGSLALKELEVERIIQRRVVISRPIQSYYSESIE